jgi:hypothetical protein
LSKTNIDETYSGGKEGSNNYIIQAATKRGTIMNYIFPNPERQPIKGETEHLVIGPFIFEFTKDSFNYTSRNEPNPRSGYEIKDNEDDIMFRVQITNHHSEELKINGFSHLSLIIPKQPTSGFHETEVCFFIVDSSSMHDNLVKYNKYNPLTIMPDQTAILKFGSNESYGNIFNIDNCLQGSGAGKNAAKTENLLTTFLVLFWEYGGSGEVIGQTIPFVSIYLPKY